MMGRRADCVKAALDECRSIATMAHMSDDKPDHEKRTTLRKRPIDQARIDALVKDIHAKTDVRPGEQDVLRVALADACKMRRLDVPPPEEAPAPGDAS
jgi:hypothetical protein